MKRVQRVFSDLDSLRFVDGRLDDERRAAFLSHLEEDVAEAERVAVWARQSEMLRAAFAGVALEPVPVTLRVGHLTPAPRPVAAAVKDLRPVAPQALPASRAPVRTPDIGGADVAYLQAKGHATAARRSLGRSHRASLSAALLFALAIFVIYVAHGVLPAGPAAVPETALVAATGSGNLLERATDAHATYALDPVHPVEFTAKQVMPMNQWLQRRLGLAVTPPNLVPEGWTLLGGRLVPGSGTPGALFVYEDAGGERLSVFAQRGTTAVPISLGSAGEGLATMSWSTGPVTYVITVGRSLDWLSRNGEDLRDQIVRVD